MIMPKFKNLFMYLFEFSDYKKILKNRLTRKLSIIKDEQPIVVIKAYFFV